MTTQRTDTTPRTAAGRRILLQDYRGNEVYTVTRADILAIEAEAAEPAPLDGATLSEAMHRAGIRVGERRVGEVMAQYARLAAGDKGSDR